MVWNKDLARLKQELKGNEGKEPVRPVPKPVQKLAPPESIENEDALFLAAMGKRRKAASLAENIAVPPEKPATPDQTPEKIDFKDAMASLKGMKPVPSANLAFSEKNPVPPPPVPVISLPALAPVIEAVSEAAPIPGSEPISTPEPLRAVPVLIQLAAGMAIEVDGSLDLRGHSPLDAIERLKERILDGHLLGWRTIHVHLGPSEELRQAFLAFLLNPEMGMVARYAQAPVPMGGALAWILYLGLPGIASH